MYRVLSSESLRLSKIKHEGWQRIWFPGWFHYADFYFSWATFPSHLTIWEQCTVAWFHDRLCRAAAFGWHCSLGLSSTVLSGSDNGARLILGVSLKQQSQGTWSHWQQLIAPNPAILASLRASSSTSVTSEVFVKHRICQVTTSFWNSQRLPTVQIRARIIKVESEASTIWL